ncbi:MAG: pilus assembly protein TadG-related protein [Telluria sp.]
MPTETVRQTQFSTRHRDRMRRKGSEDGAIAIITAFVIIIMIGMFGMALDLSRSYNRKAELQQAADAAALAAASTLDGTPEGIDRAVLEAEQTAEHSTFAYNTDSVSWSRSALTFGTSADGDPASWMDATMAKASPSKIFFARVDTSALDPKHGKVENFFIPVLSPALAKSNVAATAVAGRDSINVLPLAICANSNTDAAALPSGELAEYGFRRGVSYNLMNLNPVGRSPENFLVNPVAPPGTVGTTMKNKLDIVAPFICTGKMAIPTLRGGDVTVERGFPIDSLHVYLNSRFGKYTLPCQASTAPADQNVTSFDLAYAKMKDTPDGLSANPLTDLADPLLTVAEKPLAPTKTAYGPLWSYAKAVKYSSYADNKGVEPAAGYSTFNATSTDWGLLYKPGPEPKSYPSTTPYQDSGGAAKYKLYRNTRVLHVPLLHCSASTAISTTASVLGIAKFFMTVPATSSTLYAEFAGMNTESALGGNVRLYK